MIISNISNNEAKKRFNDFLGFVMGESDQSRVVPTLHKLIKL